MSKRKQNKNRKKAVFSRDEQMMVLLYHQENRLKTISALQNMRRGTGPDEEELRGITDSAIGKLEKMTDREFEEFDLFDLE